MLKQEILTFFRGAEGKARKATFKAEFSRRTDPKQNGGIYLNGAEFTAAVRVALNIACAGAEGWPCLQSINTNTADAVASKLDR